MRAAHDLIERFFVTDRVQCHPGECIAGLDRHPTRTMREGERQAHDYWGERMGDREKLARQDQIHGSHSNMTPPVQAGGRRFKATPTLFVSAALDAAAVLVAIRRTSDGRDLSLFFAADSRRWRVPLSKVYCLAAMPAGKYSLFWTLAAVRLFILQPPREHREADGV